MRKLVSLLLALAMVLSLVPLAMAEDVYTLDIYWIGNGDNTPIREGVEQAINEYIEPKIGANVSIHIVGWDDWVDKAENALQSGEKMDLFWTADWQNHVVQARGGLLLPLDDLLQTHGQGILDTLPEGFIEAAKIDGTLYAIHTNKEMCILRGAVVNKTAAAEIGWDVQLDDPAIKTTADMEPYLAKYKELHPDKYPLVVEGTTGIFWADYPFAPGITDFIGHKIAMDENGEFDTTIYNIFDCPETVEQINLMYKYAQAGYIDPEAPLLTYDHQSAFGRGDFLFYTLNLKGNGIKAQEMMGSYSDFSFEATEICMQPKYIDTVNAGGSSLFGIPVTSENPEKAMEYLSLMHSDPVLVNLMCYGAEGVNYEKVDDVTIRLNPDANWYGVHAGAWTCGNQGIQYVVEGEDPNKMQLLQSYSEDAIPTFSLGWRANLDDVAAEVNATADIWKEMGAPLLVGAVDPEDPDLGIEATKQAFKDAGIDIIIEEVQAQLDEWLAINGK